MSLLTTIINGVIGNEASDASKDAQIAANREATGLLRDQYNQTRADYAPYRELGYDAINGGNGIRALLGLGAQSATPTVPQVASSGGSNGSVNWMAYFEANPDVAEAWYSGAGQQHASSPEEFVQLHMKHFPGRAIAVNPNQPGAGTAPTGQQASPNGITEALRATPGYQFRMDEGAKALESSMAARGLGNSGAAQKAITRYSQGVADQTYQQTLNNMFQAANVGMGASANVTEAGNQYATGAASNASANGIARAQDSLNRAGIWQNGINEIEEGATRAFTFGYGG